MRIIDENNFLLIAFLSNRIFNKGIIIYNHYIPKLSYSDAQRSRIAECAGIEFLLLGCTVTFIYTRRVAKVK